jgi:uncharacterized protein (UPF0303 family)
MDIEQQLKVVALQEERLQFEHFDAITAFTIGSRIKALAEQRKLAVAIDIQLSGWPLFYYSMPGTGPNNADWLRRKRNTVLRFHKSSHRVDLELQQKKTTLTERQGLNAADYVAAGGGFPIILKGTGCVGVIGVSGLSRQEDHELVVEAVAEFLSHSLADLALK